MQTKDVLLVVGGVALGYFLTTRNWGKKTATGLGEVVGGVKDTATGLVADVKDIATDSKKMLACEKEWNDNVGSLSRFASAEAMAKSKSDYVANCMMKK